MFVIRTSVRGRGPRGAKRGVRIKAQVRSNVRITNIGRGGEKREMPIGAREQSSEAGGDGDWSVGCGQRGGLALAVKLAGVKLVITAAPPQQLVVRA